MAGSYIPLLSVLVLVLIIGDFVYFGVYPLIKFGTRAGYANVMTIPPNVKYQDRVLKVYREARRNERGDYGEDE